MSTLDGASPRFALRHSPSGRTGGLMRLPLFPLHAVLFPGGRLPLRVFEQRYIEMTKACVRDDVPFGVCRIIRGDEVSPRGAAPPEFATVGTLARIESWDMPQQGILHVSTAGGTRFEVRSHTIQPDGLVMAEASSLAAEPRVAVGTQFRPLAQLLELMAARVAPRHLPAEKSFDDASWVGYRLAELLPLPPSIKQNMLEINDAEVRLSVLQAFLKQHGLL
jgi:uncharacterized protein